MSSIDRWLLPLDNNQLSYHERHIMHEKSGAEHESAAAWLAAATQATFNAGINFGRKPVAGQPQTVKRLGRATDDRVRRTSILRSCSVPLFTDDDPSGPLSPISPTEKKNVRWSDSMGGQLESIKYFAISPQPIRRRYSSMAAPFLYSGLADNKSDDPNRRCALSPANFGNPSLSPDFAARLDRQSVSLHSVTTAECTVYGIIAVKNHTFIKKVWIRYSCNDWRSYVEVVANYMLGSHDGQSDKFSFAIYCKPRDFTDPLLPALAPSSPVSMALPTFHPRLYFVCRYQTDDGREFWDNNDGRNFCLNFLATDGYTCNLNTRPGA